MPPKRIHSTRFAIVERPQGRPDKRGGVFRNPLSSYHTAEFLLESVFRYFIKGIILVSMMLSGLGAREFGRNSPLIISYQEG